MREMRRKMIIRCRHTRLAAGSSCSGSSTRHHHCAQESSIVAHAALSRAFKTTNILKHDFQFLSISRSENYKNHAKLPAYTRTTVTYTISDDNVNQESPPPRSIPARV
uniref:Uncharacterized protein n=1 Tax=Trichogramma kaykai TaxID=54128 RepID=A0ABD2WBF9_9HYME